MKGYKNGVALLIFLISFGIPFFIFPKVIPQLEKSKIVGKDLHKPDQTKVAEMGGLVTISGFVAGIIVVIALKTFFNHLISVDLISILGVLSTILLIALIGIVDDLILLKKSVKAIIPLFASFPLVAIKAGHTAMNVPFVGQIDFGILYSLILVPAGITGAANAANMLAGFNGLEVGMGIAATVCLAVIAYLTGAVTSFFVLIAALGALIATFKYNWYPARVLIGDVGTLSIGAIVASSVIIGNFEVAGVIIIIPYAVDFVLKAINHFPSKGWEGIYNNGKLYCPESGPVGFCQLIMKITGGITERKLVLVFIGMEAIFGIIAVLFYLKI